MTRIQVVPNRPGGSNPGNGLALMLFGGSSDLVSRPPQLSNSAFPPPTRHCQALQASGRLVVGVPETQGARHGGGGENTVCFFPIGGLDRIGQTTNPLPDFAWRKNSTGLELRSGPATHAMCAGHNSL